MGFGGPTRRQFPRQQDAFNTLPSQGSRYLASLRQGHGNCLRHGIADERATFRREKANINIVPLKRTRHDGGFLCGLIMARWI